MNRMLKIENFGKNVLVVNGTSGAGKNAYMYGMAAHYGLHASGIICTETNPAMAALKLPTTTCTQADFSIESIIRKLTEMAQLPNIKFVMIEHLCLFGDHTRPAHKEMTHYLRVIDAVARAYDVNVAVGVPLKRDGSSIL
ncbi:hypothetical protein VPHD479_0250 [Vibrio phage D479]